MEQPRSILVIQTAFIGDVILATAVLESLHKKLPAAHIDFMVRKGNEGLVAAHPYIREVIVFDKSKKIKNLLALVGKIRRSKYDLVVNIQRFAATGIMTALSGAKTTVGFVKNPMSRFFSKKVAHSLEGPHEVERNHQLIEFLVGKDRPRPRLYPSASDFEKVREFKGRPYITISPASVWFTKQLPVEKWIEFISTVPAELTVYLLGAPGDKELCNTLIAGSGRGDVINLAGELSFLQSAALIEGARMNYANDSAPMHLASAMNAPIAAVYCSTVPAFGFGPLSDNSFIIETVEKLECRPCGLHGLRECPLGHFDCARTIEQSQLLAAIERKEPSI
ncbi:MAG TPA: glycosyltransferase family 9 protein [Cyclobacteriaceae bacterium]|nr:glycosyltransferase family 9 protein [Cyclobacteriaceae bacterium]